MRPASQVKKANKCPQVSHYRDEFHVSPFSDDHPAYIVGSRDATGFDVTLNMRRRCH